MVAGDQEAAYMLLHIFMFMLKSVLQGLYWHYFNQFLEKLSNVSKDKQPEEPWQGDKQWQSSIYSKFPFKSLVSHQT
jgi:hypothetical protein